MYTIKEMKHENYKTFLDRLETQLITNTNIKEMIEKLLSASNTHT